MTNLEVGGTDLSEVFLDFLTDDMSENDKWIWDVDFVHEEALKEWVGILF